MIELKAKNWRSVNSAALLVALAAFALAQLFASVHAAKYGDAPHDHFGQACILSLAPGGDKFVASAPAIAAAAVFVLLSISFVAPSPARTPVRIRAARPRGPPLQ